MKLPDIIFEFRGIVQALDRVAAALDRNTETMLGPKIQNVSPDPAEGVVEYLGNRESVQVEEDEFLHRLRSAASPEEREVILAEYKDLEV